MKTAPLCTSPLEIGKTYLDHRGNKCKILGFVHTMFGKADYTKVYSQSHHYDIKTGIAYDSKIVNLPPKQELEYFTKYAASVRSVNSDDKLKLVETELENMDNRIAELKALLK